MSHAPHGGPVETGGAIAVTGRPRPLGAQRDGAAPKAVPALAVRVSRGAAPAFGPAPPESWGLSARDL